MIDAAAGEVAGHEVDVVGDVDLRRLVGQVVDHVVEDPRVRGAHRIPVAVRELVDRLLLARGHERVQPGEAVALALAGGPVAQPHAVVQVDHVDAGDGAAAFAARARVAEVGRHPHHVAVLAGLGHVVGVQQDEIGARRDPVRAGGEVQVLHARVGVGRQRGRGQAGQSGTGHEHGDDGSLHDGVPPTGVSRPGIQSAGMAGASQVWMSTRLEGGRGPDGDVYQARGRPWARWERRPGRSAAASQVGRLPGLRAAAMRAADRRRHGSVEHESALACVHGLVLHAAGLAPASDDGRALAGHTACRRRAVGHDMSRPSVAVTSDPVDAALGLSKHCHSRGTATPHKGFAIGP